MNDKNDSEKKEEPPKAPTPPKTRLIRESGDVKKITDKD